MNFYAPGSNGFGHIVFVLFICLYLHLRGYSNATVRVCMGECVRRSVTLYLVDMIVTTVFARSLSNFACTFFMIIGRTLLISGQRVKGEGQLLHSVYKTL